MTGFGFVDHAQDVFLLGDDRLQGEPLAAFALVSFARGADAHTDAVDDLLDQRAWLADRVDGQLGTDEFDHVGARECGLVDVRNNVGGARHVECAARACAALGARRYVCVAVQAQTARVGAPLLFEVGPGQ